MFFILISGLLWNITCRHKSLVAVLVIRSRKYSLVHTCYDVDMSNPNNISVDSGKQILKLQVLYDKM